MMQPDTEDAVARAVRRAHDARTPLLIEGNGSKRDMLRPVQAAATLSTRALTGVTLYAPNELVFSARAGTTIAEVGATLAASGQIFAAEPPDFSALMGTDAPATLGGIVASNLSGPRRVTVGAVRDLVLGIRCVNGAGDIFRSGGRVLKNVTGLDLCKLLAGSHGTLGVLTEITLKTTPKPQLTGTLVVPAEDPAAAVTALSAALGSPFGVSGAAWVAGRGALIRIEDFSESVHYRLGRLQAQLGGDLLGDEDSLALWRAVRDATVLGAAAEDMVLRCSVRPSAAPALLAALPGFKAFLDWGGGLVWLAGPATAVSAAAVAAAASASRGTFTVMRAPAPLRATIAVVPPEPPALARITERVRETMDPHGILNPGRLRAAA